MARDLYLAAVIGFLVGWLVLLPAGNLGLGITLPLIAGSVVGFTLFAPLALSILRYLSRFWRVLYQFGKFAAVGTLNTFLDLGVLNLLIWVSGAAKGFPFVGFKAVSFLVGSTNSYFWNKFWTFQSRLPVSGPEYLRFVLFTAVGALINVGVASLIVNVIGAPAGVGERLWANVAALLAVAVSFLWNFLSYKHVVFKKIPNS